MRDIGVNQRLLLVLTAVAMVTSACGSRAQPSGDTTPEEAHDPGELERAYVSCFEELGVDARITEDGGLLFDSAGTLSREESKELIDTCRKQLEDMGLISKPTINEESLRARYEQLASVRDCLLDLGHSTPDMVSLEAFLEDPSAQAYPYDHVFGDPDLGGSEIKAIVDECPDPGGRVVISD